MLNKAVCQTSFAWVYTVGESLSVKVNKSIKLHVKHWYFFAQKNNENSAKIFWKWNIINLWNERKVATTKLICSMNNSLCAQNEPKLYIPLQEWNIMLTKNKTYSIYLINFVANNLVIQSKLAFWHAWQVTLHCDSTCNVAAEYLKLLLKIFKIF